MAAEDHGHRMFAADRASRDLGMELLDVETARRSCG